MKKRPLLPSALCLLLCIPLCILFLLAGCGGKPVRVTDSSASRKPAAIQKRGGGYYKDDGPAAEIPANLDSIPDARPRLEPLRHAANKPYVVLGKTYVPNTTLKPLRQRGIGSWYGKKFHGRKTSIGEPYDMFAMTAAHPTLALPSYARVTHLGNGRSVVVRVIDRGPFHAGRIIDLSYAAAYRLGYIDDGSARVEVEALLPTNSTSPLYAAPPVRILPAKPPLKAPEHEKFEQLMTELARQEEESEEKMAEAMEMAEMIEVSEMVEAAKAARATEPVTPAEASEPAETTKAAPPASAPGEPRGIYLQLGAFSSADNAETLRARLASELDWLTEAIQVQPGDVYRVRLGPYDNRAAAESAAEKIRTALGYRPTFVVR
jgi:rare lipoprotein A